MNISDAEPRIHPRQEYYKINKEENRLFIPEEYIGIFEKRRYEIIENKNNNI
jgi:hypothetical protein